jgi:GT2 family glycosyltransferase
MDISCVILSWNSERYLDHCLEALVVDLERHGFAYEVFVVDNGSKDRSVSILASLQARYPDTILPLYLDRNTGTTYSRNLALRRAQGRYICIIDSDVEVSQGAIAQLIHTLERDEKIGLVAPKLVYPNGCLQKSVDQFPNVFAKILRYFFLKSMERREQGRMFQQTNISEVDYAISAMWVFRRKIFEQVGFLDDNIFYSPEDVDYCLRIWKAGFNVVYNPTVTCVHQTQEISRRVIGRATIQHIIGLCYYFKKHRYIFLRPKRQQ